MLHRHLRHENIIGVKDIMVPAARDKFNDVYIVYELMDTDLHQIIRSPQPLTNEHFQYFVYQVSWHTSQMWTPPCCLDHCNSRQPWHPCSITIAVLHQAVLCRSGSQMLAAAGSATAASMHPALCHHVNPVMATGILHDPPCDATSG
jgi:hypothetical protein